MNTDPKSNRRGPIRIASKRSDPKPETEEAGTAAISQTAGPSNIGDREPVALSAFALGRAMVGKDAEARLQGVPLAAGLLITAASLIAGTTILVTGQEWIMWLLPIAAFVFFAVAVFSRRNGQ